MSPVSLLTGLLVLGLQAAPAESPQATAPLVSSPSLTAMAPGLAAVPGVVLVGYPVRGRSARAVRESLNDARPRSADGERFDANMTWRYQTRWSSGPTGECDPASAQLDMSIIVTLPELTNPELLTRRERENWNRYFMALVGHEHNHVRLALAGGEQLRTFMRGAPNCATMLAARDQIDASIREANRAYDASTGHGRTEGATFP